MGQLVSSDPGLEFAVASGMEGGDEGGGRHAQSALG